MRFSVRSVPREAPLYIHLIWWASVLSVGFIVWTIFSTRAEFATSDDFRGSPMVTAICVLASTTVAALLLLATWLRCRWERGRSSDAATDVTEQANVIFRDVMAPVAVAFVTYFMLHSLALGPMLHSLSHPLAYSGRFAVVERVPPRRSGGCLNLKIRNDEVGAFTLCGNRYGLNIRTAFDEVDASGTRSWAGLEIHSVRPVRKD